MLINNDFARSIHSEVYDKEYYYEKNGPCGWEEFLKTSGRYRSRNMEYLLSLGKLRDGMQVLDIGCGRGELIFQCVKDHRLSGVGIDYSVAAMDIAHNTVYQYATTEQKARLFFARADAQNLPFANGTFDVIFSHHVVEHLSTKQLEQMLKDCRRVLRRGGCLVFETGPNLWRLLYGHRITRFLYQIPFFGEIYRRMIGVKEIPFQAKTHEDAQYHVEEQSVLSMNQILRKNGFSSKVWAGDGEDSSFDKKEFFKRFNKIKGSLLFSIYQVLYKTFPFSIIFGDVIYAIAWLAPQKSARVRAVGGIVRNKKIYFVTSGHSSPKTGGEFYNFYIMKFLESKGEKINIIESDNVPRYIRKTHFLYNLYLIWRFHHLNDLIIIQADYLHTRLVLFNIYLKLFKNVKLICISHHPFHFGIANPALRYIDKAIEKIFYFQFEKIMVISQSTKEQIMKFGISKEKITIIPIGIDEDLMLMDSGNKLVSSQRVEILFVGNCEPRKGLEYLFDAVSRLNANYTVFIAGDDRYAPSYTAYLRRKIKEYGIEDKVSFLSRVPADRLREQYRTADIFVLPSLWEGYGIVLMEAMAFGLPIVATRVGAIPEVVTERGNGLLVEPRDADGLSKALKTLIEEPALRRRYGQASREIFRKKALSWDSVGEMAYQLIRSL